MKCSHCGFNNRKGIKFCENCGEALQSPKEKGKFCPNCGHMVRAGVSFCEECGVKLGGETPIGQPAASQSAPPVVIVQEAKKKRRGWLLWLVLLLLLLLVSCCCLMLLPELVTLPEPIEHFVNPIVEQIQKAVPGVDWVVIIEEIREVLPLPKPPAQEDLGVNGQAKKPATCDEFRTILNSADLGSETSCYKNSNECFTDIVGIEFFDGLKVDYQWEGGTRGQSTCEQVGKFIRCHFPHKQDSDRVNYWAILNGCEASLGYSDGWLPEEEPQTSQGVQGAEVEKSEAQCCSTVDPEDPVYFRNPKPNGPLFLGFGVRCKEGWDFTPNTCASFDAYVGADRDQLWTSGECCPDQESPDTFLACEAKLEDQKKSATQIQLRYGECYWEFEFQSPYYAPKEPSKGSGDCPSGESMCYGSCCSIGHCKCPPESSYCGCW